MNILENIEIRKIDGETAQVAVSLPLLGRRVLEITFADLTAAANDLIRKIEEAKNA